MPRTEWCETLKSSVPTGARIIDVGACAGEWNKLTEGLSIDAVENWEPTCIACAPLYGRAFHKDPEAFDFSSYDVVVINDDRYRDLADRLRKEGKRVLPEPKKRGRKK